MKTFILTMLLCFLSVGCATTRAVPVYEESGLTVEEKKRLACAAEEQAFLESSGIIYEDEKLEAFLYQIVSRLQPSGVRDEIHFRVKVIKDPHLNAFVLPNGTIYMHTGILARLNNEDQIAALLSHEMTHILRRHALKSFRGKDAESPTLPGRFGKFGDFLALLGSIGTMASLSGYSQELETEADLVGMAMMSAVGYDPKEVLRLFEYLKREKEEQNIKEPFFFGTHPRIERRIDNCRQYLGTSLEDKSPGQNNEIFFFVRMKKVILENTSLDLKAGRYDSARRGAEKVLKTGQGDARAYFLLGEIFRQRGGAADYGKAKAFYEKAISIDPKYPDPHEAIGLIYYKEGEWDLARQFFESCLALSPHLPERAYIEGYLKKCVQRGIDS
ncbi:M48 family metalloprotease [bacterium]|nr:M48 family metalloprotease [bacterium]